jgi:large subunit ribosomal protein L4
MPTIDVVNAEKQKVGSVALPQEVFGCKPHPALVHEAVVMQRACERQGTASTLRRGEVSGSGKKPWKQKHTGRARAGSLRSPVWRHGGSVFGPKPRSYAIDIPRKKYRAALQSALSAKVTEGAVVIVSDLALDQPKTRSLARVLGRLGVVGSALVVVGPARADVAQAARNLSRVKVVPPEQLNVYDIMRVRFLVISQTELERIKEVWS